MSDAIDKALNDGLLAPPEGFGERVIAGLPVRPQSRSSARTPDSPRFENAGRYLEWAAMAGAALTGMVQLIPLLFGIWAFTPVG